MERAAAEYEQQVEDAIAEQASCMADLADVRAGVVGGERLR